MTAILSAKDLAKLEQLRSAAMETPNDNNYDAYCDALHLSAEALISMAREALEDHELVILADGGKLRTRNASLAAPTS